MKIRRKSLFKFTAIVLPVFILVYFLISLKKIPESGNFSYIENRLKKLEKGLNKHVLEVGAIKKTIQENFVEDQVGKNKHDLSPENFAEEHIINEQSRRTSHEEQKCGLNIDQVPSPDIQMLDIYNEIPFDNVDGGVWKQGFRIDYDPHQWNKIHQKLNVFIVPHSHNDPGWINTFSEYYNHSTKNIFPNMVRHLTDNPQLKFIWNEIVYFSKYYDSLNSKETKSAIKTLIKNKQLEFVTGGWVMPDEAASHWYNILLALTEGQTWLKNTFNVTPVSSWAIDPFGHSSTMPYLLRESGFENMLIQRVHYSVKKRLAQKQELEFRWRQVWDEGSETELFTHMMPFYSYDIPHSCGPDPKVCCQFDFKRLPGYGLSCPWKIPPQIITDDNVAKKAELIVDQWQKKSMLYKTRSLLIPLGDDFRFTQSSEWEAQRVNYDKLFDYINNEPGLNVEAKFGTLQDYFDSVRKERPVEKFPSLSGDFFTYADRDTHYWSGYFTSRPYHKRMDRILLNYVRSAEILHSWFEWDKESNFEELLHKARAAASIFQHHDGVSGTAKDHVMKDYNHMMTEAIKACKIIMQQTVYRLLTKPTVYQPDFTFSYFNIDESRSAGNDENRPTIIIGAGIPKKYVALHNSLPYQRNELVEFHIAKPFVSVTDSDGITIPAQVTPVWSWHRISHGAWQPQASTTKYRLIFKVNIPPLGLTVYKINACSSIEDSTGTTFAEVTVLTENPFNVRLDEYPIPVEFDKPKDISLRIDDNSAGASFNSFGLLKSISLDVNEEETTPIHLEFLKYGVKRDTKSSSSGAYLFIPDGPAKPLNYGHPTVLVSKGKLETSISSGLPFALHENILRSGDALEIRNLVDIGDLGNTEIVMKISTGIASKSTFYTDLNGFQTVKRVRLEKIPLQGNFYPVASSIFIQDDNLRLTVLTAQPLGGSSLSAGEISIMQERRLNQDDDRGLGQGVLDNRPVLNIFKVILENREACRKLDERYPAAFATSHSFYELRKMLHPVEKYIFNENEWAGYLSNFGEHHESLEMGMELVTMKNLPHVKINRKNAVGVVIHRTNFEYCTTDSQRDGLLNIRKLLGKVEDTKIFKTHLTLLEKHEQILTDDISLCPMNIKAFILSR